MDERMGEDAYKLDKSEGGQGRRDEKGVKKVEGECE